MFTPRLPIDRVMALISAVRNDELTIVLGLESVAMITGELSAFLKENKIGLDTTVEVPVTLDLLFAMADEMNAEVVAAGADAKLNPIWIPVIIKIIELIVSSESQPRAADKN